MGLARPLDLRAIMTDTAELEHHVASPALCAVTTSARVRVGKQNGKPRPRSTTPLQQVEPGYAYCSYPRARLGSPAIYSQCACASEACCLWVGLLSFRSCRISFASSPDSRPFLLLLYLLRPCCRRTANPSCCAGAGEFFGETHLRAREYEKEVRILLQHGEAALTGTLHIRRPANLRSRERLTSAWRYIGSQRTHWPAVTPPGFCYDSHGPRDQQTLLLSAANANLRRDASEARR